MVDCRKSEQATGRFAAFNDPGGFQMSQRTALLNRAQGFTLVEVALAVAVGLIVIGGAVLGYNAVKDNAANANARERLLDAVTIVEEYASVNAGQYPIGGRDDFTRMWKRKHPDDYNSSPWGGSTGASGGVNEGHPTVIGGADATTATTLGALAGVGSPGTGVPGQAADLSYVDASGWVSVTAASVASNVTVKNYLIGIFDKNGMPWWDVKGGH
jgi:type II secretory pathway pseudopilin PulG